MDIKALADKYNDYIIERRRYYHTCPELSNEEKETRASLHKDLEAMGITEGYCTFTIASRTGEGLTSASTFTKRRRCVMSDSLCIR